MEKLIEQIKAKLRTLEVHDDYILDDNYPPRTVDKLLGEISGKGVCIGEDWNGCDLDWSVWFDFEGKKIYSWGSAYDGNVGFEREKD